MKWNEPASVQKIELKRIQLAMALDPYIRFEAREIEQYYRHCREELVLHATALLMQDAGLPGEDKWPMQVECANQYEYEPADFIARFMDKHGNKWWLKQIRRLILENDLQNTWLHDFFASRKRCCTITNHYQNLYKPTFTLYVAPPGVDRIDIGRV